MGTAAPPGNGARSGSLHDRPLLPGKLYDTPVTPAPDTVSVSETTFPPASVPEPVQVPSYGPPAAAAGDQKARRQKAARRRAEVRSRKSEAAEPGRETKGGGWRFI